MISSKLTLLVCAILDFTILVSLQAAPAESRQEQFETPPICKQLLTVSSIGMPGTPVSTQLVNAAAVNGKVVLPAGTYFSGKFITSRRLMSTSDRLTVNLTGARLGVRDILITTTGLRLLANNFRASGDVKVSRAWDTIAAGKRLQFQLARPLVL